MNAEVAPTVAPNPLRLGIVVWLATGMWLGLMPFAPGTIGALLGLPLAWGVGLLSEPWARAALIVVICIVSVPICTLAVRRLGRSKDPGCIVLDEIASLPITFFLVPMDGVAIVVAGFVLHRVFDIVKPPPARQLEHLREGWGVMADDWSAGVYSCLLLHLLRWTNPWHLFAA